MQYLYRGRMRKAATMLRAEDATVASIATRVGYGSEAAFSAAFTRHTGMPPGPTAVSPLPQTPRPDERRA